MEKFERIIKDIASSFSMENLKLSDKMVLDMKNIYENKKIDDKGLVLKRRKMVRYDFRRK